MFQAGFEVPVIDAVKSDQGGKQVPVCLGNLLTNKVALLFQALFDQVQS